MVTIIHIKDLMENKPVSETYDDIASFLLSNFSTRDELLDLRFFYDELLGEEIDQTNGDFISIDSGTVVVVHDSQLPKGPESWIYFAVALIVGVAAAIALKPNIPELGGNNSQQSATNRLGDTTNEPRINQRIDDIFGTLTKHVPPLWQVPYRIGVNNQEVEVLYLCVGRGKYAINASEWYDGDTPVVNIPNAAVSVYGPNTHPSNGSPVLQIGQTINEQIGIYRQSNDLNPSELVPPNEDETAQIIWTATGSTTSVTLTATSIPEGFILAQEYKVGEAFKVKDMVYAAPLGNKTLYYVEDGPIAAGIATFATPVDLSADNTLTYTVTAVNTNTVTLSVPTSAPVAVKNAWAAMTNYSFPTLLYHITSEKPTDCYTTDVRVVNYNYYEKDAQDVYYLINYVGPVNYAPSLGSEINSTIGPLFVPKNATKIILNFVSPSGFYKLVDNKEQFLTANIEVKIREVNSSGAFTGQVTTYLFGYASNPDSTRRSVFCTERITLPYSRCTVEAKRTTNRDKNDNVSNVDIIEWRDLYSFEPVSVTSFGDVTTAHVLIPSNSESRLIKSRKQNVTLTRKITQYNGNGSFGAVESFATDRFDQILIHTALDPYIGRLSLNEINADGFLSLYNEISSYFGSNDMCKFGYDFDNTALTYQDTFMTICNAVMCTAFSQFGVYDAVFEKAQLTSTMQITVRNKIMDTETRTYNYDPKYDGVELTYRSNDTGTTDTIYIPSDRSAKNPERITANGITTQLQAHRYACRVYNRQRYQTTVVKFDVDEFGRNVLPNRRIDSPDSTRFTVREDAQDGYRVFDGEVVNASGLDVELSRPVEFKAGENHYITFTKDTGESIESILCTAVDEYTVRLAALPSTAIYTGYDRDRTKFVFVSEQLKESVALLPKTIEFSLSDDGNEVHTITSVNYDSRYYKDDLSTPTPE